MINDVNVTVSNLLDDMGLAQSSKQSQMGYQRAAHTILLLEVMLPSLVQPGGELPKIANVGPKSLIVIHEVLATGGSPTVESAVDAAGKRDVVETKRRLRENCLSRAKILEALADPTLVGPTRETYRGDFQMHTRWSDGDLEVAEMARACMDRGYQYAALTDHGHGLPAHGITMEDFARQRVEIDQVNAEMGDRFCLLAGVEANIALDGSLDLSREDREQLDLVVAAPHSGLRLPEDQTARMTAAVRNPGVHILGHPRGRQRGNREGIRANWDEVFATAARHRVAVELDGDPARQDLDFGIARRALEAGCVFALDSDAHRAGELGYSDIAIGHARLAGIPPERVLNTWPLPQLLDWLADRTPR